MPTDPDSPPLRVAECGECGQLFALYATEGAVACPICAALADVAALEVAELRVAQPVESPEPEPEPAPVTPAPVAEDRPPTVAEWLMRGGDPNITASSDPPAPEPPSTPEPKPSLSDSLGWRAEAPEPASAPPPAVDLPATEDKPRSLTDEFRFDFGSTPLAESPGDDQETREGAASPPDSEVSLDFSRLSHEPPKRGRLTSVSAVAALLLVGGGAAYYLMDSEPSPFAEVANRESRRVLPPEQESDPSPPKPFPPESDTFEAPTPLAEPIVDPATQPASYNEPNSNLPPAEAASDLPRESSFDSPLPPLPPASQPPPSRYATPASDDRYAAIPAATEPQRLQPLEGVADPFNTPVGRPAPRVGLLDVPTNRVEELTAATASGEEAAARFAAGTLADPEQVSVMGQHYARLCYLAQVLTLLDPEATGSDASIAEMEAVDVFARLFRTQKPRTESRQIAAPWIAWTGRPHGGVFFAGEPKDLARVGEIIEYRFDVNGTEVPVLMTERLDPKRYLSKGATEVGVIGVVIDEPRRWIAGYEGDAERVVWARSTAPLRLPEEL